MTVLFFSMMGFSAQARTGGKRSAFNKAFQKAMSKSEKDLQKKSRRVEKHRKYRAEKSNKFGDKSVQIQLTNHLDVQAAHRSGSSSLMGGLGERKSRLSKESFQGDIEAELSESADGLTELEEGVIEDVGPQRFTAGEASLED